MKAFHRLIFIVLLVIMVLFVGTNLYMNGISAERERTYRVEAERLAADISMQGYDRTDLSKYPSIISVCGLTDTNNESETVSFFQGESSDYLIRKIDGIYYRFDYRTDNSLYHRKMLINVNIVLGIMAVFVFALLFYIRINLLRPFALLAETPYELSKGNLTLPLKERRSRYFGRFVWGMDLLREELEQQKTDALKLQKEKKTLILSLSHDIKTPLLAIKLYAKALSKNIYDNPEKNIGIAQRINEKSDEIEAFLSQIIKASEEDFLKLSVQNSEFYMSGIIKKIEEYYTDKLKLLKIGFVVSQYTDCLLKGDMERAIEILQNVIENAVKYGDGEYIRIDFADEEQCRLITVSNSGCSLPENEMPHIFNSFWRGSNAGKQSGSGLGLYICRQLINKMDGEIFAQCKNGVMSVTVLFRKI